MKRKRYFAPILFCLLTLIGCLAVSASEFHIPDTHLEQAIREEIGVPDTIPLKPLHLKMLSRLIVNDRSITDITGLEDAIHLEILDLGNNPKLSDLRPIASLTKLRWLSFAGTQVEDLNPLVRLSNLETLYMWVTPVSDLAPLAALTNLRALNAGGCNISDATPLAALTQLKYLHLHYNFIEDVTPLAKLIHLIELDLRFNRIVDIRPFAKLTHLKKLWIQGNEIADHSSLDALSLEVFEYDQNFVLPSLPIQHRIQNRRFPSVFSAWGGIGWSSVLNLPEKSDLEQMALHDLYFCCLIFHQKIRDTPDGKQVMGEMPKAIELRDAYLAQNPHMLFIAEIRMRDAFPTTYPEDSPYWLRNENGDRIPGWPGTFLLDFTKPIVIDKIVQETIAVAKCGLYDGIFFDWWSEDFVVLADDSPQGYQTEQRARDVILSQIRAAVTDDFLILANTNRRKIPRTAWAINGTFMETGRDYDEGYTYKGLKQIESTLSWAEKNLREPQINCLEGWGVTTEPPDSLLNKKWMRVFTTMSLTHSDGYVLYNDGIQHQHNWYDFWNVDLGKPITSTSQRYNSVNGLFIRKFDNGWAVYNRSGETQTIILPFSQSVSGNKAGNHHSIPDLDGNIYIRLKTQKVDVNGDGTVNILDLVIIANNLGRLEPDLNDDGTVNILDLVIVADAFE